MDYLGSFSGPQLMLQACSHDKPDQKVKLHALTSLTCSWWEGSYAYLRWVRTTIAYGIPCFGAINIQHHPTIFLWTQGTDRSDRWKWFKVGLNR